jgi:hypothetical protein
LKRRTFLLAVAATAVGAAAGAQLTLRRRSQAGPRYLARDPESGVWGITRDPEREEGVWVRHPSGVLAIGPVGAPRGAVMVADDEEVVGFRPVEEVPE